MINHSHVHFTFKDFSDLDNSDKADFLIRSMEAHYRLKSMRSIKQRALDMLDVEANDDVIELGCGLGIDSEIIGQLAYRGTVTAVDISEKMLKEATSRSRCKNVLYALADARKLPYADNSFTKCRLDRLLVSQENYLTVFEEAKRITKPKGKICVTDLDFSTLFLYPIIGEINSLIIEHWSNLVMNPLIARRLPVIFLANKIRNLQLQPEIFVIRSYQTLKEIIEFEVILDDMQALGKITQHDKASVIQAFEQADIKGDFFWSINLLSVVGTKL